MTNRFSRRGRCFAAASLVVLSASANCFGQQTSEQPGEQPGDQTGYIEASWMKVRQDKVAEFGQMAVRIADANRRGHGDHWIAFMDIYGKDNFIWMASGRESLTEVEPAMNSFMGALKEFMGYSPERFFAEVSKLVESSGSELWRPRYDLSWNVKNQAGWTSHLAMAHCLASIAVRVKPGHMLDAEKQFRMVRDAAVGNGDTTPVLVTQVVMGGDPGTFYVRIPFESVAGLAKMASPRSILGEEGYRTYSEMSAQDFASVDYSFKRLVPEWSNPPASFIEANPKLWKAKPMLPAKPKPAAANNKPPAAGQ